ncbi:MAG: NAD(P)H-binding protein [Nitrospirota bacterium]
MVLVTGATGFVGSHLVKGLSAAGFKVRALVRDSKSSEGIEGPGVEVAVGDVTKPGTVAEVCSGCSSVIHLVGIIQEGPGYTFKSIHVDGTRNIIEAARRAGTVRHFIYQSALGARTGARTAYHRTKYEAEELTRGSGLNFSITRPSIIYGKGDGFTAKLIDIIRKGPVVPVPGPVKARTQPVFIGDLVEVFIKILENPAWFGRTIEVGGPEELTLDEINLALMDALGIKKPLVHVPLSIMKPAAAVMEKILSRPPVTTDQLIMLEEGNTCPLKDMHELGINPIPFRQGLTRFLP